MLVGVTTAAASNAGLTGWVEDDLVIGEAVALDLPPASLGERMASGLIDVLLTLGILLVVGVAMLLAASPASESILWVAYIGTMIVVFLVLPTTIETWTRGRSVGKLALGLRAVRDDAGPVSFQHSFVRALIGFVEIYAFSGAPAFFCALVNRKGKRLGDLAAGTYVVRERYRLTMPPPILLPDQLRGWAGSADLAPLPSGLAIGVRQYLARLDQFTPAARAQLEPRLVDQVMPYVSPPPPAGTPPAAFLAAVVALRRERDLARLGREQELRDRLTRHAWSRVNGDVTRWP